MVNSLAESLANFAPMFLLRFMSIGRLYVVAYVASCICYSIIMFSEFARGEAVIPVGVLGAKGGAATAFCALYFSLLNYFTP